MERDPVLGEFGDRRLEEGGAFLLERLCTVGQSGVCIRTLGGDRAGELRITRFLRNEQVTPEEMFATAGARTASLVQGCHILAIQDTTPLRDRACPRTLDPGGKKNSLQLHPTVALSLASQPVRFM